MSEHERENKSRSGGPERGPEAFLSQQERAIVRRFLKFGEEFPPEFRSYIEQVASTDTQIRPSQIAGLAAWNKWTPVLTGSTGNPTLGTGSTQAGNYTRIGKLIVANAHVIAGSSGFVNGSGTVECTIPVAPRKVTTSFPLGSCAFYDDSVTTSYPGQVLYLSSIEVRFRIQGINLGTFTSPFTWAASDQLHFSLTYQADD